MPTSKSNGAFDRLAPFIQKYIYQNKWQDLRDVQKDACSAILDTSDHVLVASGTASGKTEAAFFPVLTKLDAEEPESIGAIYLGPTKALINDQFKRLEELLADQEHLPVYAWHGDISQSKKTKAKKTARGILLITPESLESALTCHPEDIPRLFGDLRFIVIDEMHSFIGTDRGLQLQCLLVRLERLGKCNPRRIGLSATMSDYRTAQEYLTSGTKRKCTTVGTSPQKRKIALGVEAFNLPFQCASEESSYVISQFNNYVYDNCRNKKAIIFTNSRAAAEEIIGAMQSIALVRQEPNIFYSHHSSVGASLRKEVETRMKEGKGAAVTAATLSLEMGIDIGDLDTTIQIGAPQSCSGFVQRLGRSGRRTGKSKMMFVLQTSELDDDKLLCKIPWDLIQTLAIMQLYIEEKWVEAFETKPKPYSLLVQQTLAHIKTFPGISAAELAKKMLTLPPFSAITPDEYRLLLRNLLNKDVIMRFENGGLYIGAAGEFVHKFDFYAVFEGSETAEYQVFHNGSLVGTLARGVTAGESFMLAGKPWIVDSVDRSSRTIFAKPTFTAKARSWGGSGSGSDYVSIQDKIMKRMRQVLEEDTVYPQLHPNAVKLLEEARMYARYSGVLDEYIVFDEELGKAIVFPWCSFKCLRSIWNILSSFKITHRLGIKSCALAKYFIEINTSLDKATFMENLRTTSFDPDDPGEVLDDDEVPQKDKYDSLVPAELLRKAYIYNILDLPEAWATLQNIIASE